MDKALDETWGHKDRRTSPLPRAIVAQEAAESLEPGPKRLTKQLDQRVRTPRARGLFLRLADVQGCGRGLHLGAVGAAAAFSEGALQGGLAVSEPEVVRQLERGEALWVSAAEAPAGCCAGFWFPLIKMMPFSAPCSQTLPSHEKVGPPRSQTASTSPVWCLARAGTTDASCVHSFVHSLIQL
ncbi:uncharacterized protein LOC100023060 isoform X9 [Monodelphis domestica]|uniref:uncharacterized protein LOC100023060 isoform X9 n=1 Tax=Monodelphis domestica TaxID=13616 RepID=UPI0024E1EB49|nr:uncharacterized protein LOC100023060 isoform X9 [Monodelphis domestica]